MPLCPSANPDSVSLSQESMNRTTLLPQLESLDNEQFDPPFERVVDLHPAPLTAIGGRPLYNLAGEGSVLKVDCTTRTLLPLPRVLEGATSTAESQTLPTPLEEFRGVSHATRYPLEEAIDCNVGQLVRERAVGAPLRLVAWTQSLTCDKTASLARRPSTPGVSPHAALMNSIGAASIASQRELVDASAAVLASTMPDATAPLVSTFQQRDRPSSPITAFSVAAASCTASSPLSFVCDATSRIASVMRSVATASVQTLSTSSQSIQTRPRTAARSRILILGLRIVAESAAISAGLPDFNILGEGSVLSDIDTTRADIRRRALLSRDFGCAPSTHRTPMLQTDLELLQGGCSALRNEYQEAFRHGDVDRASRLAIALSCWRRPRRSPPLMLLLRP